MKFYFGLKSIPELAPLSPSQRTDVWAPNAGALFSDPVMLLTLLCCGLFAGVGSYCGEKFIPWSHGYLAGPLVFFPISYTVFWSWSVDRLRPRLKQTIEKLYGGEDK